MSDPNSAMESKPRTETRSPRVNSQRPNCPVTDQARFGWTGVACAAAVLAISLVAISSRSFWIDEACAGVLAMQVTLGDWWHIMSQDRTSTLQLPLSMFSMWGWGRLFGTGEWTLRLANLPWFVAGATAFILAYPPGDRRRPIAACVVLLCPFAWYYLDEARPYAMQLGASLFVVASLARLARNPPLAEARDTADVALFLFGIVVLCGSSLIGVIWAGSALLCAPALLSWTRTISLVKRHVSLWLAAGGMLLLTGGYYLWTLTVGARASAAATTTLSSTLFVGYELLGFSGLGPGRLIMRSAGPAALRPYLLWLVLYAVPIAILIGIALRQLMMYGNRRHAAAAFCCCLAGAFLLAVGWVAHFRVLGRHFTPFAPVLLLLFTLGGSILWSRRGAWARGVVMLFFALSLASCLFLRFLPRHEKDDYRAAAALAKAALRDGQPVWWSAAPEGALYYGVPTTTVTGSGAAALLVMNPSRETLHGLPAPQVVIASKPDVYDNQATLAEYVRERRFQPERSLSAFVIWRKDGH